MIRVSVLYPNSEGSKFDHDYYANTHLPMVVDRLTPLGLLGGEVNVGLAGGTPDAPAPFVAVGHLMYNSVEEFQNGFGVHGEEIMGDLVNFTDIEPIIQISEVVE